jgi:hypothetical protein
MACASSVGAALAMAEAESAVAAAMAVNVRFLVPSLRLSGDSPAESGSGCSRIASVVGRGLR